MKKHIAARIFVILQLLLFASAAPFSSIAEVYIGKDKPEDWDSRDLLTVVVAETNYNDAIFIRQGEHKMMIDGGVNKFRKRIVKYMQDNGFTEVDIYFNTHPHDDHLEAVCTMIDRQEIIPKQFLSPFPEEYRNKLHRKTVRRLKEKDIPYVQVKNEDEFTLGDKTHFTVFQWPEGNDPNELSGILLLRFGDATMLLTGDLSGDGQKWLAKTYGDKIHVDILKEPHHGLVVMVPDFLHTVNPDFVFITSRTVATKRANTQLDNAKIPYTHHSKGTIIMETDGTDWYVTQTAGLI